MSKISTSKKKDQVRLSFGGKEKLMKKSVANLISLQSKFDESQIEQLNVEDIDEFPMTEVPQEEVKQSPEVRAPRETAMFNKMIGRNYEIINSRNNDAESNKNIMGLIGKISYFSQ